MYKKRAILFLILISTVNLYCQTNSDYLPEAESLIFELYRNQQSEDIDYSDFYESLFQYFMNPLDLNSCVDEELRSLYILNDTQISAIRDHIQLYGSFHSVYELQTIPSLSMEIIRKLRPFVTVRTETANIQSFIQKLKTPDQHYLLLRATHNFETSKGYKSSGDHPAAYHGDPENLYVKYRYHKYKNVSFGLTAEKDAGELFSLNRNKRIYGFDFLSSHAMIYGKGRFKRFIVGDYQLQFGQGLVLSGGFFTGKGAETILSIRRSTTGIRPYTSLLETGFFRGCASTVQLGKVELTTFLSERYLDGSQSYDFTADLERAVIRYTGLHRTVTELISQNSVKEQLGGINAHYTSKNRKLQLGSNSMVLQYDQNLKSAAGLYNYHQFNGSQNYNLSLYYSLFYRNISFFGETALCKSGGTGNIHGALLSLGRGADMSLVYRNYSTKLHLPYGNSFGENYKNSNETGLYWGLKFRINKKTELSGYFDFYIFPWLKYRVSAPSQGKEFLLSVKYKLSKKINFSFQFREETKERDDIDERSQKIMAVYKRHNISLICDIKSEANFFLKSRVQYSAFNMKKTSFGYFLSQDVGFKWPRFEITARIALFDTDDFETRQYAYEADVLYAFSIPFFSGKGMRNYIVTKYNLTKRLGVWLKYSRTTYFDRTSNGSGNDLIDGNLNSDFRVEFRYILK